MVSCSVLGCRNRHERAMSGISFHRFPINCQAIQKWILACGRENWTPSPSARICSAHFEDQFYINSSNQLKPNTYPTKSIHNRSSGLKKRKGETEDLEKTPRKRRLRRIIERKPRLKKLRAVRQSKRSTSSAGCDTIVTPAPYETVAVIRKLSSINVNQNNANLDRGSYDWHVKFQLRYCGSDDLWTRRREHRLNLFNIDNHVLNKEDVVNLLWCLWDLICIIAANIVEWYRVDEKCIGNYQSCGRWSEPCCRQRQLEDPCNVPEDFICDHLSGGICRPLSAIRNLDEYIKLTKNLKSTDISERTDVYRKTLGFSAMDSIIMYVSYFYSGCLVSGVIIVLVIYVRMIKNYVKSPSIEIVDYVNKAPCCLCL